MHYGLRNVFFLSKQSNTNRQLLKEGGEKEDDSKMIMKYDQQMRLFSPNSEALTNRCPVCMMH